MRKLFPVGDFMPELAPLVRTSPDKPIARVGSRKTAFKTQKNI